MAIKNTIRSLGCQIGGKIPGLERMYNNRHTQDPNALVHLFSQIILCFNHLLRCSRRFTGAVINSQHTLAGVDACRKFCPACYIRAIYKAYVRCSNQIDPSFAIVSANDESYDTRKYIEETTWIDAFSWIKMNSVGPGCAALGDSTIALPASVVTKSFEQGYCVIEGNLARKIKQDDNLQCRLFKNLQNI